MSTATALITGAGGGIGRALVSLLLAEGVQVVATDCRCLQHLRDDYFQSQLHTMELDVTDPKAVAYTVENVEKRIGPLNYLVNAAGVMCSMPTFELGAEQWQRSLAVNASGVFYVSREVGRRMADRGQGSIVTVTSNAAFTPRCGMVAYSASKAAAEMVTKTLGLELAGHGVRCNVVAPGSTDTSMLTGLWNDHDAARMASVNGMPSQFRLGIPLGKIAQPEDIAQAVLFLLGPTASHLTMHRLTVDGGATLGTA